MAAELLRIYNLLDQLSSKMNRIETKIDSLDEKMELSLSIQRNHLIRIKNGQSISDDMIMLGRPYNDLSPQDSLRIYSNPDLEYIFLDVSAADFVSKFELTGVVKIPLEDLAQEYLAILNNKTPILIISEDGLRSILACEFLVRRGYFNVNNVSGGYEFWPHRDVNVLALAEMKMGGKKEKEKKKIVIDEQDFDTKLWEEKESNG